MFLLQAHHDHPTPDVSFPRTLVACSFPRSILAWCLHGFQSSGPVLDLAALPTSVRTTNSESWDATTTEVVERTPDRLLVRTRRLNQHNAIQLALAMKTVATAPIKVAITRNVARTVSYFPSSSFFVWVSLVETAMEEIS